MVSCCSRLPATGAFAAFGSVDEGCLVAVPAAFGCGWLEPPDVVDGAWLVDGFDVDVDGAGSEGLGAAGSGAGAGGAGAGGGGGTVGAACWATAPRSWTLTTGAETPATAMLVGAAPGSPVHGTETPLA